MKRQFSEITIHKQLEHGRAPKACYVEIDGTEPITLSLDETLDKIQMSLCKEFARIPIGSSLRIMVLVQEREVQND